MHPLTVLVYRKILMFHGNGKKEQGWSLATTKNSHLRSPEPQNSQKLESNQTDDMSHSLAN